MAADTTVDRTGCPARLHGTRWAYDRHGCRCPDAKATKRRPQVHGTGRHPVGRRNAVADPENVAAALYRIHQGDPAPILNAPECRAVVHALTRMGWSARDIAVTLGLAQRSVVRHRAAARATAKQAA